MALEVKLGGRDYPVVAQGIGRIRRKLGSLIGISEGDGLTGEIDGQVHDLLRTFIPDIAPLHELMGYRSEDEMKAGGDPEGGIEEVTLPQLIDAVDTIYVVNGADRLVRLGKALGLSRDLISETLNKEIAERSLARSVSLPAPSGESGSASSSTTEATSPERNGTPSPSPASSTSSTPAVAA